MCSSACTRRIVGDPCASTHFAFALSFVWWGGVFIFFGVAANSMPILFFGASLVIVAPLYYCACVERHGASSSSPNHNIERETDGARSDIEYVALLGID